MKQNSPGIVYMVNLYLHTLLYTYIWNNFAPIPFEREKNYFEEKELAKAMYHHF